MTFLLTDVVDSSRLWDEHPAEMARAMARHDAIVRKAVETCGGVMVKSRGEGDSTFSVFQRATDAVYATRAMALAMDKEPWSEGCVLHLRSALHTGEALERDGDYYGPTVNRAARLRESAVGDEILMTAATVGVVVDHLPKDCSLVALGLRAFRGISRPESVHSLVIRSGNEDASLVELTELLPLPARLSNVPLAGFHGREAELGILRRRVEETRTGNHRCVFISGEPGIGKSTLSGHVCREAHADGAAILYGRCEEGVGAPYGPWAELLAQLARHAPASLLDEVGARNLGELAHIAPELTDRIGSRARPTNSDPESERYLLFGAVAALLRTMAARGPLVVVLDDLQWADRSTLLLLRHIVSLAEPAPVLIIATYRNSDLQLDHPLNDLLVGLRRESSVDRLSLTGLAASEMLAVVETVSGQTMSGHELQLVNEVHRETGGNPFFAWEILLHLSETGLIGLSDTGSWVARATLTPAMLPDSVKEVVGQRVSRLGSRTQRALETAAVMGRDFELELLAAVLDESQDDVLEQLEAAEAANLVQSQSLGQYAFTHALIEHSLYGAISETRRARTHLRIAECWETLGGAVKAPADMVLHWTSAGNGYRRRAVPYAVVAAHKSLSALAPQDAIAWFNRAISLHLEHKNPDDAMHCELLIGLGKAQLEAGQSDFRDTLLRASAMATNSDQLVRAALSNNRGFPGSVDPDRIAVLEQALEVVDAGDHGTRAKLLARIAAEWGVGGDFSRRRALADEALAIARATGSDSNILYVLNQITPALTVPETLSERVRHTREACELAERLENPQQGSVAWLHRIQSAVESARHDEATSGLRRLREWSNLVGQPAIQWMAEWAECTWAVITGDIARAEALATRALELGIESGQPDATTIYGGQLLSIRWHQGRDVELLDMMKALAAERSDLPVLIAATARIMSDNHEPVVCTLETVRDIGYDLAWCTSLGTWAEVAARNGDAPSREHLYELLSPYPDYIINIEAVCLGSASHYLGLLAASMGNLDKATAHFAAAERSHEALRAPFHLSRTRLEWGRTLLAMGTDRHRTRAAELLELAHEMATAKGCGGVERQAAQLLTQLS